MRVLTPAGGVRLGPATMATVARTVPLPVAAIALLALLPSVVVAVSGRQGFTGALTAASVVAGAGAGYAADDPAAPTLASSPTPLAVRRALRAAMVVLPLGAAWMGALLVAARYGHPAPVVPPYAAELAATAAVSAAVAGRARTDGPVAVGSGAAATALLAVIVVSSLSYRWPAFPSLGGGAAHARWWWVAAAGLALAALGSRDPAGLRVGRWTARRPGAPPPADPPDSRNGP